MFFVDVRVLTKILKTAFTGTEHSWQFEDAACYKTHRRDGTAEGGKRFYGQELADSGGVKVAFVFIVCSLCGYPFILLKISTVV